MESAYISSVKKHEQLPKWDYPEIVFLGRSNSGKSSLLNALMERKSLARVSSTPGRTQMINFFSLSPEKGQTVVLSDLPGWGFSSAAKEIQALWDSLLESYLKVPNIKDFLALIDVRRDFLPHEIDFFKTLSKRAPISIVLTKADKVKAKEISQAQARVKKSFEGRKIPLTEIFVVSALRKQGVDELRTFILRHLTPQESPAV